MHECRHEGTMTLKCSAGWTVKTNDGGMLSSRSRKLSKRLEKCYLERKRTHLLTENRENTYAELLSWFWCDVSSFSSLSTPCVNFRPHSVFQNDFT